MSDIAHRALVKCSEEIGRLRDQITTLTSERDHWKANHDNQVRIKQTILDRPDLQDRAKRVQDILAERDEARERCRTLKEAAKAMDRAWREKAPLAWQPEDHADLLSALRSALTPPEWTQPQKESTTKGRAGA